MLSFFILAFACFALLKFGIFQWRAILITSASHSLSDSLQAQTGIDGAAIGPRDFRSILDFCDQLSPGLRKTSPWLREVSLYYRAIAKLEQVFRTKLPSIASWASREMQLCSRYVAVVLDQHLAMNLDRQFVARSN